MKIAVCFSGQARYIEENFQNIKKNLIDPFNCDVFCHFWNRTVAETSGREPHLGYQYFPADEVNNLYTPLGLVIEENPDPYIFRLTDKFLESTLESASPKEFWFERGQTFRVLSQYLSVLKSIELKKEYEKENRFKYDYVIRSRSDFMFPRPVCFSDLPLSGEITLLPDRRPAVKNPLTPDAPVTDSFAIGSSEDMDLYCNTFNCLPEATERKIKLTGEGFSACNMRKHGLKLRYSDLANYQSFYTPTC